MNNLGFLAILGSLVSIAAAQDSVMTPVPPQENTIIGQYRSVDGNAKQPPAASSAPKYTYVLPGDKIFPHLVSGSGWETILVLVNLGYSTVEFNQYFYDQTGAPMKVTFRSVPEGVITTTAALWGRLGPGASHNILLFDAGTPLQVGWSSLSYDSTTSRIGGYAIFRSRVAGRTDFEALVPLSGNDDTMFYLPFDNLEGFVTSMALLNPASNMPAKVSLRFLDKQGDVIITDTITLPASNQTAFSIPERYPAVSGRTGTVLVEGDITRLSALGFRFNPQGAFATIPILNWSGMFE